MKDIKQLEWDYNLKKSITDIYPILAKSVLDNTGFNYFYYEISFDEYNNIYESRLWCRNSGQTVAYGKTLLEATKNTNDWHFNFVNSFLEEF